MMIEIGKPLANHFFYLDRLITLKCVCYPYPSPKYLVGDEDGGRGRETETRHIYLKNNFQPHRFVYTHWWGALCVFLLPLVTKT